MGSEEIDVKFEVVGPIAPKDAGTAATLKAALDEAWSNIDDAHTTTSLVSSEPVMILGNLYMILTYYDAA